jgi:transposase
MVDGLQDAGFHTELANPAGMEQYSGLKHTDDKSDAFWLAEMLRLGILTTGHICERQPRSVRDLLRRRMLLVHQRTGLLLSLESPYARALGRRLSQSEAKQMTIKQAREPFATLLSVLYRCAREWSWLRRNSGIPLLSGCAP